jgi:hypothetical protein
VSSIIDWEMAMPGLGRMTSAELLEVENGVIVRGERQRRAPLASYHLRGCTESAFGCISS